MAHKVICINRTCGSGGHLIGEQVAKELGIGYYDHNLLDMALEYGDLHGSKDVQSFKNADEKATNPAFYRLRYEGNEKVEHGKPATETVFQLQRDLIREITQEEDCVVVGRCANCILDPAKVDFLSVFVTASFDYRVAHIMQSDQLSKFQAERRTKQIDKRRKDYYYCFTKTQWQDYTNYDMMLNSETVGFDNCVKLLCNYFENIL